MGKPRRNIVRKVMFGLVVLLFVARIGAIWKPQPPELAADCDRPAFELSTETVEQRRAVGYAMTGTAGRTYVLGVDTRTFERRPDGGWNPVPAAGVARVDVVAAPAERMPGDCLRDGQFGTPIDVGEHTVTMFELTDRGAVFVAQQVLEVTEP
jgi:hypothetical protein